MKPKPAAELRDAGAVESPESFWEAARLLAEARRLISAGQPALAEDLCRQVLRAQPRHPDCLHQLGLLLLGRGRGELSVPLLRRAVDANPLLPQFRIDLGHALRAQGMVDEALSMYAEAYALDQDPGLRVNMAMLLPVIPQSREDILAWRTRLEREIDRLTEEGDVALEDPMTEVGFTAFHLAYHGLSDRALQEKIARFYIRACPSLEWTAPHCLPGEAAPAPDGRHRIGLVSTYFRYHTIAKVTRGMIELLSRDTFHVTVFHFGAEDDWTETINASADWTVKLSGTLADMRRQIANERLDLLYYPDVGMHPTTYFLAFARLAPVQCVTWGHPVTTGIPAMDYYVSSKRLEPEGSDAEYSERLERLPTLPTYYSRPPAPSPNASRARFGFADHLRLYVCPQLLFKLHPDFDSVLGEILRRDPHGILLFLEGAEGSDSNRMVLFRQRFGRVNPDVADRLVFRPFLEPQDFIDLLSIADVLLDPPYFGGGNTSLEAFSVGAPIVTWPGPFARGRTTLACYRTMEILDGVVATLDEYADRAVRIANDRAWRDDIRARILARNHLLYEDIGAIRAMERFFARAISESRASGVQAVAGNTPG